MDDAGFLALVVSLVLRNLQRDVVSTTSSLVDLQIELDELLKHLIVMELPHALVANPSFFNPAWDSRVFWNWAGWLKGCSLGP